MENLKEEICAFLKGKGAGAKLKALEIAKGVGQTTAKDVNKALYDLQRAGCLQKAEGQPPLWSLGGSCRSTGVDVAPNSIGTPSKQEIKEILRSHTGGEGITAKKLARDLNQPRKSVNSQLYGMLKSGEVERMSSSRDDASLWKWCDENGSRNNMKEESCDSADDSSGWTIDECSDSGTLVSGDTAVSRFQEDYSTFEKLGTGGFGAIYKAERNLDKKYYAIKVVKYHQYASREVEALAKFDHSNIVRYYTAWTESSRPPSRKSTELSGEEESGEEESGEEESGEEESGEEESSVPNRSNSTPKMYLYIQMELCDRGTLTKWIENRNHGEVKIKKEPLEIFYKILNGVEYIHSQEHIHRDLKPDNILFGSDGTVKIGDFGLVTVIKNKNGASVKRTMNIGTESYMSPEQEDQSTYDEKVDIFALGLIFFELLWTVGSGMERAKLWPDLRRAEFPREFCSEFTSEHAVIRKMLSQAPGERPSAKAIAMKLKKASNQTR